MKNTLILEIGKENDSVVYALNQGDCLVAVSSNEAKRFGYDVCIKCDSGCYPVCGDVNQYIANRAYEENKAAVAKQYCE